MNVIKIPILNAIDIIAARQNVRTLGAVLGFSNAELTGLATAVSELTRNIITYANEGSITFSTIKTAERHGILIVVEDNGPGIENLSLAMKDGYSTGKTLGLGLPGARRLMDEFQIESAPGRGNCDNDDQMENSQ